MTNFRKWFKGEYPGGHTSGYYFAHKAWQYRQQEIDQLKAQLNNMEACYIEKKKERDELRAVLKCVSEHFEMNDLDSCMPRLFEMIQEALRGAND